MPVVRRDGVGTWERGMGANEKQRTMAKAAEQGVQGGVKGGSGSKGRGRAKICSRRGAAVAVCEGADVREEERAQAQHRARPAISSNQSCHAPQPSQTSLRTLVVLAYFYCWSFDEQLLVLTGVEEPTDGYEERGGAALDATTDAIAAAEVATAAAAAFAAASIVDTDVVFWKETVVGVLEAGLATCTAELGAAAAAAASEAATTALAATPGHLLLFNQRVTCFVSFLPGAAAAGAVCGVVGGAADAFSLF
eukprot:1493998-Pleurochrysis_carterae.AAC.1